MAEVEAFVWHDAAGNIVAVGHAHPASTKLAEPRVQAGSGHGVVRHRADEAVLRTLHLSHSVDVASGRLRPRSTAG
ncbi:hypothetical protein [Paraburkholderia unamae]|uniref:Uncharacterized protein n=1 Tax=Paraburkholderia unamae TaxID=219649 RepID=A0ACC6RX07_9BURK